MKQKAQDWNKENEVWNNLYVKFEFIIIQICV